MRFIKGFLPHLAISLVLGLALMVYLDERNPLMAFLTSGVSKIYILILCIVCLTVAVLYVAEQRRQSDD